MDRIVDLPSLKPRSTRRHQGLRKLSPDLIIKARDETAAQVTRIGLTFLGTAAFCLLSLLSPDSALLDGNEKIQVPGAGPVSFIGFMLLGPAVLIVLRIYLQIYVEHSDRLDRLGRSVSPVRAPTLIPLQNSLIRLFSGLIFYLLLPVAMLLFAWKAAVFPIWGGGLFAVATAVIVGHLMLPFGRFSWRSKTLLSVGAAMIVAAAMFGFGPLHRPFDLFRANLSGQWLPLQDLRDANLELANLSAADLSGADLSRANLSGANLSRANLSANLSGANLSGANLTGASLTPANLKEANLKEANLSGADLMMTTLLKANLNGANLSGAFLGAAQLNGAHLSAANLKGANLSAADLSGADLSGANLSGADLTGGANLNGANLKEANLSRADLSDANLSDARNVTQTKLDAACGNADTKLPEGLTLKPCSKD
jgi:uncharacterized protein YjbI with pentapeptide repeats